MKQIDAYDFYRGYESHKNWLETDTIGHESSAYFQALFEELGISKPITILEIGFGQGHLLDWARSAGHRITGVELLPEMADRAKSRGHDVVYGPFEGTNFTSSHFDLLVALDVIEHLTLPELVAFFESARSTLKPGGRIVLRFPNGQSPFFGFHQHSDITHKQCLSRSAVSQVCAPLGFEVTRSIRLRTYPKGLMPKLRRCCAYVLRAGIEYVIGYAYYGGKKNLDPNQVLLITHCGKN